MNSEKMGKTVNNENRRLRVQYDINYRKLSALHLLRPSGGTDRLQSSESSAEDNRVGSFVHNVVGEWMVCAEVSLHGHTAGHHFETW